MTSVDARAIRAITQELTSLKVTDSDGQSIARTAKLIRSTLTWLEMVNMIPPDAYAIVYDILETCTVPDFLLYLKTLSTNAALNQTKLSIEELLQKAEEMFRILILSKKWDITSHQGSTFQVQQSRPRRPSRQNSNMPPWHRTAPKDNELHEKMYEGKHFKWCSTCKRWFFGSRAHLTAEHVQGFSQATPEISASINTVTPNEIDPSEGQELPLGQDGMNNLRRTYFSEGI